MGEIADQIIDQMIFGWRPRRKTKGGFQKGVGKGMWRSAEGPLDMRDMTSSHLSNALNTCIKTNNNGKADELRAELKRRGLMK